MAAGIEGIQGDGRVSGSHLGILAWDAGAHGGHAVEPPPCGR